MNFLFTCGGTAGHINPALAVAGVLRDRMPDCGILFVGANGKMETDLVPRAGYDIVTVEVTNIHRSLKPSEIAYNFRSLHNARQATKDARKIIEDFQPDIAIGTGGYVSGPVVLSAAKMGICCPPPAARPSTRLSFRSPNQSCGTNFTGVSFTSHCPFFAAA